MNKRILFLLTAVLLLFMAMPVTVNAEEETGITGFCKTSDKYGDEMGVDAVYIKLTDDDGNRIRNPKTGEALSVRTDTDGRFTFDVPPGEYRLYLRLPETFEAFEVGAGQSVDDTGALLLRVAVPSKGRADVVATLRGAAEDYFEARMTAEKESRGIGGRFRQWIDRWEWSPVLTSLKTAVTGIFFTFFLGLLLVRLIRSIRWRPLYLILDGILTLPMVLPPTVIGFFLLRLLGVNSFIGQLFLDFFDFRIVFSWASTVIAAVTLSLPLMYKSTMGAMEQVDENLVYAARTLGFSERRIFWRILVPNAVSGIAAATILAFARGLGEYGATSMIAGNILGQTRTLPIAVAVTTSAGQDDQANFYAAVIVVVSLILLTVMNYVTLRMSRRGGRQ